MHHRQDAIAELVVIVFDEIDEPRADLDLRRPLDRDLSCAHSCGAFDLGLGVVGDG
jgi:hypothetical protein